MIPLSLHTNVIASEHTTSACLLAQGSVASLLAAYLLHWLPYATQQRQTFLFYYLPAYYFAILLSARAFDEVTKLAAVPIRSALRVSLLVGICAATGSVSLQLAPIAFGSPVLLGEWTAALTLASTECWFGPCWANKA